METLNVYLCNNFAGELTRANNGALSFCYDGQYLSSPNAAVLSSTLPLSETPYAERDIAAFFSNLLPDESVRQRIAEILHVTPEDTFGLLRILGGDCAGAISFYEPGTKPDDAIQPSYRTLSAAEACSLLNDLSNHPLGIDEEFRGISGAGAQDKLIACLKDGHILLPLHSTPSTHIIKPGIDRFPESVFNEWFCMQLARRCGFITASADIITFGGYSYYVTARYDRKTTNGVTRRLHQEDFCQLLKCRPEIKYQDQGGPSVVDCVKLIRSLRLPATDLLSFVDRVIFNFLVGNGDAHGKNFSVLYANGVPRLAPVYDVLCTTVYPPIAKKMAMKFDGKFEFRWITAGKIIRTFSRAEVGEKLVQDSINHLCTTIRKELPSLVDEANVHHPSTIYHDIIRGIHQRLRQINQESN